MPPKKTPKKAAPAQQSSESESDDSDPDKWTEEQLREEYKKLKLHEKKQQSKSKNTRNTVDRKDRHLFSGSDKDVWYGYAQEWWRKMDYECQKAYVPNDHYIEEMSNAMVGAAARWFQAIRPGLLDVNEDNVTQQDCINQFRRLFFDHYCGPNYAFNSFLQLLEMRYNSGEQTIADYVAAFRSKLAQVNVVRSDTFGSSPDALGAIFYHGLDPQLQQKVYPDMTLRQATAFEAVVNIATAHAFGKASEPAQAAPAFYSGTSTSHGSSNGRPPFHSTRHGQSPGRPPGHLPQSRSPFPMAPGYVPGYAVIDNAGNVVSFQEVPPPNQPLPAPPKGFLAWRPGEEPQDLDTYRMPHAHEDPAYYVKFEDTTHPPEG